MTTITLSQEQKIREYVNSHHLPKGLGTKEEACSIAAINLALSGELTDKIPDCMSEVAGNVILILQDSMPDEMRNSQVWKDLLPYAAGTGRDYEQERKRIKIVLNWMWEAVLPLVQPVADTHGFGIQWKRMCTEKTNDAADAAARAAYAARAARAADAAARAAAADAAADAAYAAYAAARAAAATAADVVYAVYAAANAAALAAYAAARAAAATAADTELWQKLNPVGLLKQLIDVGGLHGNN